MRSYVIKIAPVTKKNSQRILSSGNRRFIAPSENYVEYARKAAWFLHPLPPKPIEGPVNIRCLFYLPTRRRTDLTNLLEAVDDIMVDCGVLADDNYKVVAGHDGSRCYVDKSNPRTEIYIEEMEEEHEQEES